MSAGKMHADEIDIDAHLVSRLIAAQFPEWADLHIRPVPSAGTVNALFRLGEDKVVRLPRVPRRVKDLDREQRWLPFLAPFLPLAIPVPLAKGTPAESYPWDWSVYRWLEGETATIEAIADPHQAALDLAQFVHALHRIDPTGAPPSGRGLLPTRDAGSRWGLEALQDIIDTDAATEAWEDSLRAPAFDGPPIWTHGDMLPANLLVKDGRLSAVIDFGGAGAGDPACDMLAAWSLFPAETREVFRSALGVDDATWLRGRGFALHVALAALPYYQGTNPLFVALASYIIEEVLADHERMSR